MDIIKEFCDITILIVNDSHITYDNILGSNGEYFYAKKIIWINPRTNTYKVCDWSEEDREVKLQCSWEEAYELMSEDADVILLKDKPAIIKNYNRAGHIEERLSDLEASDRNNKQIKFWDFVEKINFPKTDAGYKEAIEICGGDKILLNHLHTLALDYAYLMTEIHIFDWCNTYIPESDDGIHYLFTYIVSLGKEQYIKHLQNSKLLRNRSLNYNYREGFSYLFFE